MRSTCCCLLAVMLLLAALAAQQTPPPAEDAAVQSLPTSPAITALQNRLQAGDRNAVAAFWTDAAKRTTPIVEPAAGSLGHVIVTFLWRGAPATQSVVLRAQLGRTRDPNENTMTQVPGTDVWYRAYRLRDDLRF